MSTETKPSDARVGAGRNAAIRNMQEAGIYMSDGWLRELVSAVIAAADAAGAQQGVRVANEAAPSGEAVAWVPPVVKSAPERIWLQVSDEPRHIHGEFPSDHDGITWCEDSALSCEVGYVRADLAHPAPAPAESVRTNAVPDGLSEDAKRVIADWLALNMEVAVKNGANSVSMPDEFVEIAAWLCAAPPPPSQPPSAANEQKEPQ